MKDSHLKVHPQPWKDSKTTAVTSHPAWHGEMKAEEAEALLIGQTAYTYLLRSDENFFLSFVAEDGQICHKQISLEPSLRGWLYKNGMSNVRESVVELLPVAMHCRPQEAKALVAVAQVAQG